MCSFVQKDLVWFLFDFPTHFCNWGRIHWVFQTWGKSNYNICKQYLFLLSRKLSMNPIINECNELLRQDIKFTDIATHQSIHQSIWETYSHFLLRTVDRLFDKGCRHSSQWFWLVECRQSARHQSVVLCIHFMGYKQVWRAVAQILWLEVSYKRERCLIHKVLHQKLI